MCGFAPERPQKKAAGVLPAALWTSLLTFASAKSPTTGSGKIRKEEPAKAGGVRGGSGGSKGLHDVTLRNEFLY
jgi:hypothetical protein